MLPLTRHGLREMLIGTLVLLLMAAGLGWAWWPLALLILPLLAFLFAFFRDPHRAVPLDQLTMVSPADGVVSDITLVDNDPDLGGPAVRIGIFLSVFNVHVNRAPCDGRVVDLRYKTGKFLNALDHAGASADNESNTVVLAEPASDRRIAVVKQIVGLIARRIIFTHRVGDTVRRGDRIGMIKFGSRTELTIPMWLSPTVTVRVGQSVRGASDVVATLGQPVHTTAPSPAAAGGVVL